jgi:hypothetical protein
MIMKVKRKARAGGCVTEDDVDVCTEGKRKMMMMMMMRRCRREGKRREGIEASGKQFRMTMMMV